MQLAPTFLLTRHVFLQCGFTQCGTVPVLQSENSFRQILLNAKTLQFPKNLQSFFYFFQVRERFPPAAA